MCGIFGVLNYKNREISEKSVLSMGSAIAYRGPDDHGIYLDKKMAIGNQRLSIIDLAGGHQPMFSKDKKIVVVQNGEIFNYLELREELSTQGYHFQTHSDTEVILALYEKLGEKFASRLNGMFAIAIIDKNQNKLLLFRDRFGEKPLYIARNSEYILFASEIKSILNYHKFTEIDETALSIFMQFGFVPPPYTMFKNIEHVMPGHFVSMSPDASTFEQRAWWDLADLSEDVAMSVDTAVKKTQSIFSDAVNIRMRADVPFGAFLSGGIDSSYTVSAMTRFTEKPIQTFNVAFPNTIFDEGVFAKSISERFRTQHRSIKAEVDILAQWPKFIYHCDQPHADISFIPTLLLSQLTSQHVKMVLTGDGADELFAGYTKYLPLCDAPPKSSEDIMSRYLRDHSIFPFLELKKYGDRFSGENPFASLLKSQLQKLKHFDFYNQYFALDCLNLLPGNNLVKPDRMGMAYSIEARQPFMDYRMIEHAFQIPGEMKVREKMTKYILKKASVDAIGKETAYRSKRMFTVPVTEWSQRGFAKIAEGLLLQSGSYVGELLGGKDIEAMIVEHRINTQDHLKKIRALISLELWHQLFIEQKSLPEVSENFRHYLQ